MKQKLSGRLQVRQFSRKHWLVILRKSKIFTLYENFGWIHLQYRVCRAFSDDVTSAILASQNNGMAVMFVFQINPVGDELFSWVNASLVPLICRIASGLLIGKSSIAVAFAHWIFPFRFNLIINKNKKSNRQIR